VFFHTTRARSGSLILTPGGIGSSGCSRHSFTKCIVNICFKNAVDYFHPKTLRLSDRYCAKDCRRDRQSGRVAQYSPTLSIPPFLEKFEGLQRAGGKNAPSSHLPGSPF
jgi:hypothetical protein